MEGGGVGVWTGRVTGKSMRIHLSKLPFSKTEEALVSLSAGNSLINLVWRHLLLN